MAQSTRLVIVLMVNCMQLAQVILKKNTPESVLTCSIEDGTIRLWQTDPTKPYGLWQKEVEI